MCYNKIGGEASEIAAGLSQERLGFVTWSVTVGFVLDKWHWDSFFIEFFGFPLSMSFHRVFILIYYVGDE
jgi:hypothetical protein